MRFEENWRSPVEMVEIFHCRFVRIDVEHVGLESRVCQQFVCHVGQVNTHYGKGVPETPHLEFTIIGREEENAINNCVFYFRIQKCEKKCLNNSFI